jgi:hypothetical protein
VCRKLKLDPRLSPCTSINSKRIEDLNLAISTGKSREYSGSNRYQQGPPQQNSSNPATKRKDGQMRLHEIKKAYVQQEKWSLFLPLLQSGRKYLLAIHQTKDW